MLTTPSKGGRVVDRAPLVADREVRHVDVPVRAPTVEPHDVLARCIAEVIAAAAGPQVHGQEGYPLVDKAVLDGGKEGVGGYAGGEVAGEAQDAGGPTGEERRGGGVGELRRGVGKACKEPRVRVSRATGPEAMEPSAGSVRR